MSNLISGREAISSAVPAHIAERISDSPDFYRDAEAQQAAFEQRVADAQAAILEGDGLHTWARDDYAYELVDLVHHLNAIGKSRNEIGDASVQWLRDMAERQARREVELRS